MQIHIGKEIKKVYHQSGMKLSEFAKRANTSSRNVYSIFERKEIKTDQLQKIGEVLGFNFFSFYQPESKRFMVEESTSPYHSAAKTITVLVYLDGTQPTIERHIKRIIAINRMIMESE